MRTILAAALLLWAPLPRSTIATLQPDRDRACSGRHEAWLACAPGESSAAAAAISASAICSCTALKTSGVSSPCLRPAGREGAAQRAGPSGSHTLGASPDGCPACLYSGTHPHPPRTTSTAAKRLQKGCNECAASAGPTQIGRAHV